MHVGCPSEQLNEHELVFVLDEMLNEIRRTLEHLCNEIRYIEKYSDSTSLPYS